MEFTGVVEIESLHETCFFLPEGGDAARAKFMELVAIPSPGWYSEYGFTMPEVFAVITEQEAKGIPQRLLIDNMQARGHAAYPQIKALAESMKCGTLTLTTAGSGSRRTSAIWHSKVLIKEALDGGPPWCWEASINISAGGWNQGNTGRVFRSQIWADHMRAQHDIHVAWAREHEPHYQVSALSEGETPVERYFKALAVYDFLDDVQDAFDRIASKEKMGSSAHQLAVVSEQVIKAEEGLDLGKICKLTRRQRHLLVDACARVALVGSLSDTLPMPPQLLYDGD